MAGNLGTEANLLEWKDKDIKLLASQVELYKEARDIIYGGDLYRLESPYEGSRVAFNYVSKDKNEAVLFAYLHPKPLKKPGRLKLKGLAPSASYEIRTDGRTLTMTGATLMKKGLDLKLKKIEDSAVAVLYKC